MGDIKHGTATAYQKHRCRCTTCKRGNADRVAEYRTRKVAGTTEPPISAAEAQRHVNALRESGVSIKAIAHRSGVGPKTVSWISTGRAKQVMPIVAASILGVELDYTPPVPPTKTVDAIGTRRRLQALQFNGWALSEILALIGKPSAYSWQLLNAPTVTKATADAVATLYDEIWDAPSPNTYGGRRAASRARSRGWVGPMSWDDIDNPRERPKGMTRSAAA